MGLFGLYLCLFGLFPRFDAFDDRNNRYADHRNNENQFGCGHRKSVPIKRGGRRIASLLVRGVPKGHVAQDAQHDDEDEMGKRSRQKRPKAVRGPDEKKQEEDDE